MKIINKTIIILLFISSLPVFGIQDSEKNPWKLKINRNGIQIFNRTVEGSPIKEFMGKCVIDSSMYTIGLIMMDFPGYMEWVASCKELKKLSCKDDLNCTLYYVMDLPWPVSNRDVILKASATLQSADGTIIANCTSIVDESIPVPKGYVRLKSMYIKWILKQLPDGKTDVTFLSWADPSGQIPPFIANMSTADMPYKTLVNLSKIVQLPKYADEGRNINAGNYKQKLKMTR